MRIEVKTKIDNKIRIETKNLSRSILKELKDEFRHHNPDFFKAKNMGRWVGGTPSKIVTFELEDDGKIITIPRGGEGSWNKIALNNFIKEDRSIEVCQEPAKYQWKSGLKLWPFQKEAVDIILARKNSLILGGTSSGKTIIALAAIAASGMKAGIIVPNRILFDQWLEVIEERLGIPRKDIGKVGGGHKFKIGDQITVMMQKSAYNKIKELKNLFGFICLDECHRCAARTFLEVMDSFNARYRLGVTATVKRNDGKHFLTYDMFGPVCFEIKKEFLREEGYVTPVELHVIKTDFYFDYLREDFFQDLHDNEVIDLDLMDVDSKEKYCKKRGLPTNNYNEYLGEIHKDDARNNLIFKYVKKEYDEKNKSLIFSRRREYCEVWEEALARKGIDMAIFWGGGGNKEKRRVQEDVLRMRDGKLMIGMGTIVDEGVSLPIVKVGFVTYRNAKNFGQLTQQEGRFARLFEGQTRGRLYYFWDHKITRFKKDIKLLKKVFKEIIIYG
ncbi:MAG: DEAD/DEAH box helicase family protein [Candidatus Peribacteraceae bacterium]|nr:DEAD/DEAH box helicase family protein [Candidatus Peribacteraceae bacterium]